MGKASAKVESLSHRRTAPIRGVVRRPRSAEELANWPTQLLHTTEGPVCAISIAPAPGWPTVALLHGWAMNRSAWAQAALPVVDAGFGIFVPDLAGHGDTPDIAGELGSGAATHFERIARQLDQAAEQLSMPTLALAGYSMGAMVALNWAKLAPGRIERLMLLDPIVRVPAFQMLLNPGSHLSFYSKMARAFVAPNSTMPSVFAAMTMAGLPLPNLLRRPAIDALLKRSGYGTNSMYESYVSETHESDVDAFLAGLQRTDRRAIARCFEAKNRSDLMTTLVNFRGPLTLLTAESDAFCPPSWLHGVAEKARKNGVSAQFTVIDDCDHLSICQRPAAVAAAMVVWLNRPATSSASAR